MAASKKKNIPHLQDIRRCWHIAIGFGLLLVVNPMEEASADVYIDVVATYNGGRDTAGVASHYFGFDEQMALFAPPYTVRVYARPLSDSTCSAEIDFLELGPGYSHRHEDAQMVFGEPQRFAGLPSKGVMFDYELVIRKDTASILNPVPVDSMTNHESVHFKAFIWPATYAEYKWSTRSGYLEHIYNLYRKRLKITRAGKIDMYVFPASNNTCQIDNRSGVGFDIAGKRLYTVFNDGFDSALPENAQCFVLYETWGYAPRMMVMGMARYYLDDGYRAKDVISDMPPAQIRNLLSDESPDEAYLADVTSGAFVKFLADEYSLADFRTLYQKSAPGKMAFEEVYKKSFEKLIEQFLKYEKGLELTESIAAFYGDVYSAQMWFDRALPYRKWLAARSENQEYHLRRLAATLFYLGDYQAADSAYAQLEKSFPDDDRITYLHGLSAMRIGNVDYGTRLLETAARKVSDAAKFLAEMHLDHGRLTQAKAILGRIGGAPDSWTAVLKARLAAAEGDSKQAEQMASTGGKLAYDVVAAAPGEARGYMDAAYAHMLLGSYTEAGQELEIALFVDKRPYYAALAWLAKGRLHDLQDERAAAVECYGVASQLNSGEYIRSLASFHLENPFRLK